MGALAVVFQWCSSRPSSSKMGVCRLLPSALAAFVMLGAVVARADDLDDPKEVLKKLDTDGDGKLTFKEVWDGVMEDAAHEDEEEKKKFESEFKPKLDKHFAASDADKDDSLNLEELMALMKAFEQDEEEL